MNKSGQRYQPRFSFWMEDESYEAPLDEIRVPGTDGTMYVCQGKKLGGCQTLLVTAIFGALKNQNQRTTRSRESNSGSSAGFRKVRAVVICNRSGYLMGWEPRGDVLYKPPWYPEGVSAVSHIRPPPERTSAVHSRGGGGGGVTSVQCRRTETLGATCLAIATQSDGGSILAGGFSGLFLVASSSLVFLSPISVDCLIWFFLGVCLHGILWFRFLSVFYMRI